MGAADHPDPKGAQCSYWAFEIVEMVLSVWKGICPRAEREQMIVSDQRTGSYPMLITVGF